MAEVLSTNRNDVKVLLLLTSALCWVAAIIAVLARLPWWVAAFNVVFFLLCAFAYRKQP